MILVWIFTNLLPKCTVGMDQQDEGNALMTNIIEVDQVDWLDHLDQSVTEDFHLKQRLLITGTEVNNNLPWVLCHVSAYLQQKHSTFIVGLNNKTAHTTSLVATLSLYSSRHANLVIILNHPSQDLYNNTITYINFLNQLTGSLIRPRILIILSSDHKTNDYEPSLKNMWSHKYLDVTILDIMSTNITNVFVHHWNPYTNVYKKIEFSEMIEWFPYKAGNLNGLQLVLGVSLSDKDFLLFPRNKKPVNIGGMYGLLAKYLSNRLNFTMDYIAYGSSNRFLFAKQYIGGRTVNHDLRQGRINMIGNFAPVQAIAIGKTRQKYEFSFTSYFTHMHYDVYVPIDYASKVSVPNNFGFSLFCAAWTVGFICVAARILRYELRSWQPYYVWNALVGIGDVNVPESIHEKVVFLFLIAISVFYWGDIIEEMAKFNLEVFDKMNLSTLEDIEKSKLTPATYPVLWTYVSLSGSAKTQDVIQKLIHRNMIFISKHHKREYDNISCIPYRMGRFKNTACIFPSFMKNFLLSESEVYGNMYKTIEADPVTNWVSYLMEANAPYGEPIEEELKPVVEYGFWRMLLEAHATKEAKYLLSYKIVTGEANNLEKHNLIDQSFLFQILAIGASGWIASVVIFVAEVVIHYYGFQLFSVFSKHGSKLHGKAKLSFSFLSKRLRVRLRRIKVRRIQIKPATKIHT